MATIIAHFLMGKHIFADTADNTVVLREGRDFRPPFDERARCQRTVAAGKTSVARRQCRIARLLWILFLSLALRRRRAESHHLPRAFSCDFYARLLSLRTNAIAQCSWSMSNNFETISDATIPFLRWSVLWLNKLVNWASEIIISRNNKTLIISFNNFYEIIKKIVV